MLPWFELLQNDSVRGLEPLDAHTHIGSNDPDGYSCTREQLVDALERIDAAGLRLPNARAGRLSAPPTTW